ncbi:MAG: DUF2027 domain-containing protein [Bacteroidaceae bacterium]|nr:DUF2027 domain-containing protein [Bacteroidaceae bacterium]
MEIGQKVRFLNEVGGGTISGFQGKDIVLVEDEDGFDIPMLRSQVVVIETNANNFEHKKTTGKPVASQVVSEKSHVSATVEQKKESSFRFLEDGAIDDPADREVTFHPKAVERKGGDTMNVHLAFIPENVRELTQTRFETYLINDSNYFLHAVVATAENAAWHLMWEGTIEPNTKILLNIFERNELPQMERMSVQLHAWKVDKPFVMKSAVSTILRIDSVKFYKLHVFQTSPFFREPALIYDVVSHDEVTEADEEQDLADVIEEMTEQQRKAEIEAKKQAKAQYKREVAERDPRYSKPKRTLGDDVIEVDLHISALLDNTNGLSNSVLLNTQLTEFRTIMERNKANKGQKIVFIHGKGEGVLREAIIKELRHRYRNCEYQDASFREYGFGATLVIVH